MAKYSSIIKNSLSLRLRIFISLVIVILLTAFTIGILTFYHFQQTTKVYHENRLARKEKTIIETIDYALTDYETAASQENIKDILRNRIHQFSDINDIHINLYSLNGNLLLSSQAGVSSNQKKVPIEILKRISPQDDRYEVRKTVDENTYLTTYSFIYNSNQKPIAIISLPYKHDDSFLRKELITLLERFLGVVVFVLIAGAWVSWLLSNSITSKLKKVGERLKRTNMTKSNYPIVYNNDDEVKIIVDSYNDMLQQLNQQSEHLLKIEREETWREAARQVAHELKNPLTPMRLQIQSFQRKFDPKEEDIKDKVDEFSVGLIKQVDVITDIAEAFADFTKMPVRKDEEIEITKEIRTALDIFDNDLIALKISEQPIFINFDSGYLIRVMTNLIKNALQAIPVGVKPEIIINIKKEFNRVVVEIIDNGTGISDEMIDKLFEPKFSTKSSGSGLGLPMVKKIIEEYDGTIRFKNNINAGTTFIFTLPIIEK